MNKNLLRFGVLAGILILLLILAGGAWWFFLGRYTTAAVPPASPVQVFLLSPSSGDDVSAGDFVMVDLQAVAPEAISWSEVFVDGQSLGAVRESPERASWTWQAWPAGVHVLAGRSEAADGQLGESQTVILNVVVTDETMQTMAGPSETLAQVGAKFGASPDQMAAANPKLDPSTPLSDGQPVNVPTGGSQPAGGGSPGGGSGPGGGKVPFVINWELKLNGQADESYCYLSDGSGKWEKMPQPPFEFFGGVDNLYSQVFDVTPPTEATIQAQCWGWLGGVLKYLGQGQTKVVNQGPIQVIGDNFQLTGLPKWPEGKEEKFTGGGTYVAAPFAVRQPKDTADCTAHAAPIVGPFICNTLMNAKVKEYFVLEWEWQPHPPEPGKTWVNDIAGYEIYEIMPDTEAPAIHLKDVKPLGARAAALPMMWSGSGLRCYGVRAFAEGPTYNGKLVSEMAIHCPGGGAPPESIHLTPPDAWLTAADVLRTGDCIGGDLGMADYQNGAGVVFVGAYTYDNGDCYENVYYNAAVKFNVDASALPPGAVVRDAFLRFTPSMQFPKPGAGKGKSCVLAIGKATQAWTGLNDADHWIYSYGLGQYALPLISSPQYGTILLNVTPAVKDWLKNPSKNHGFILYAVNPPSSSGSSYCVSSAANFILDIYYFKP